MLCVPRKLRPEAFDHAAVSCTRFNLHRFIQGHLDFSRRKRRHRCGLIAGTDRHRQPQSVIYGQGRHGAGNASQTEHSADYAAGNKHTGKCRHDAVGGLESVPQAEAGLPFTLLSGKQDSIA